MQRVMDTIPHHDTTLDPESPAARAVGPALLLGVAVGVTGVLVVGLAVAPCTRRRINLRAHLR
jgi:hypothetical protein